MVSGEEECERESIMAVGKLSSLLPLGLDTLSPDTRTHTHIVTFPEDSVDQFSLLILMET